MQVFGRAADPLGKQKYNATFEELATVVIGMLGEPGYEEVVRRSALVIATGNNDAHLKNWSLLYRNPARPVLAPLYDQVASVAWSALDRTLALKLAGARDFGRVNADSFETLARKTGANVSRTQGAVRQTLESLRASWSRLHADLPLPPEHKVLLRDHWTKVPLLRDVGALD